jgi:hypothetical protein
VIAKVPWPQALAAAQTPPKNEMGIFILYSGGFSRLAAWFRAIDSDCRNICYSFLAKGFAYFAAEPASNLGRKRRFPEGDGQQGFVISQVRSFLISVF